MTPEEFKEASQSILRRAKEKAFSKGCPIYFGQNGVIMAEYPDRLLNRLKINKIEGKKSPPFRKFYFFGKKIPYSFTLS